MNKLFIFADGDSIGSLMGRHVLMDDTQGFVDQAKKINEGNAAIAQWIQASGGQVLNNGGDEVVGFVDPKFEEQLEEIRQKYQQITGHTLTIGIGFTMSQAGKALMLGKISGKDQISKYDENTDDSIRQSHESVAQGQGSDEEQKIDDHYFDEDFYNEDTQDQQDPEMQDQDFDPEMQDDSVDNMMQTPDQDFDMEQDYSDGEDFDPEMQDQDFEQDDLSEVDGQQDEMSSFENETPIEIPGEEAFDQEDPNAEKADDMDPEMADLEQDPEMQGEYSDPSDLESEMSDESSNEEIMQRIAQNLAMFKENQELMEQIKQQKPDLYQSILGLLHNMIELAKIVNPEAAGQFDENQIDENQNQQAPMENPQQQAPQGIPPQLPKM